MFKSYKVKDRRKTGIYLYERYYEYDKETKKNEYRGKKYLGKLDEDGNLIRKDTLLGVRRYRFDDFLNTEERFPLLDRLFFDINSSANQKSYSEIKTTYKYDYLYLTQPKEYYPEYICIYWNSKFSNLHIQLSKPPEKPDVKVIIRNTSKKAYPDSDSWFIGKTLSLLDVNKNFDYSELKLDDYKLVATKNITEIEQNEISIVWSIYNYITTDFYYRIQISKLESDFCLEEFGRFLKHYLMQYKYDALLENINQIANKCICIFPDKEEVRDYDINPL